MTKIITSDFDTKFRVMCSSKSERPNLQAYLDLHTCYAEKSVIDDYEKYASWSDEKLGQLVVDKCIKNGHYGIVESPHISFICEGFPHDVIVQARTHRIGCTWNVQSQRYTGERIKKLYYNTRPYVNTEELSKLFYFRPLGSYTDRQGNKYEYNEGQRAEDYNILFNNVERYVGRIDLAGFSFEQARQMLLPNIRQDFTVTFNARSLMHFLDMRTPKDAQLEIRELAYMFFEHFKLWMPELAEWYGQKRLGKNKLSP